MARADGQGPAVAPEPEKEASAEPEPEPEGGGEGGGARRTWKEVQGFDQEPETVRCVVLSTTCSVTPARSTPRL